MGLFFYATNGWNWHSYRGFMATKHECDWHENAEYDPNNPFRYIEGIQCFGSGMVKYLRLGEFDNVIVITSYDVLM